MLKHQKKYKINNHRIKPFLQIWFLGETCPQRTDELKSWSAYHMIGQFSFNSSFSSFLSYSSWTLHASSDTYICILDDPSIGSSSSREISKTDLLPWLEFVVSTLWWSTTSSSMSSITTSCSSSDWEFKSSITGWSVSGSWGATTRTPTFLLFLFPV